MKMNVCRCRLVLYILTYVRIIKMIGKRVKIGWFVRGLPMETECNHSLVVFLPQRFVPV